MQAYITRRSEIKHSKETLSTIDSRRHTTNLIHYSCESFFENTRGSNRVTSIAIRNLDSAQTTSFSIFHQAERMHITPEKITENYETIEKEVLNKLFNYIHTHSNDPYAHWNMRDINFGFRAIEHRGEVLRCNVQRIPDNQKIDLARLLKRRYSRN